MLDLEDQLRSYGEAVERTLLDDPISAPAVARTRRRRGRALGLAAAAIVVVGIAVAIVASSSRDGDRVATENLGPRSDSDVPRAGVFTTPTDTVLLFSDGIDGAVAVDLDRRLVGRRVVDGERAGDQEFRLTITGDRLIVGWGEIYAAPLDGGASTKIADATIHLPAAEDGQVWTLTWEGGRIGAGDATLRRITTDGAVVFETTAFDPATLAPVQGVPGGLLVDSPDGVAVWDAETGTTGAVLGPGPVFAATTDGRVVAWCAESCGNIHVAALDQTGPPTARHAASRGRHIALSPAGSRLAVLQPAGDGANLVVADPTDPANGRIVARGLDPFGALTWTPDGGRLLYAESVRVGLYDPATDRWEIQALPVGGALSPVAVTRTEARSFFAETLVDPADCPGPGITFPSGRDGVCTFAFVTPDSPDECVAEGPRTIEVPDVVGLPLEEAAIQTQQAGLTIVGNGTAATDDPTGPDAVVRAQEPPAGELVPAGACVGFRTDSSTGSTDVPAGRWGGVTDWVLPAGTRTTIEISEQYPVRSVRGLMTVIRPNGFARDAILVPARSVAEMEASLGPLTPLESRPDDPTEEGVARFLWNELDVEVLTTQLEGWFVLVPDGSGVAERALLRSELEELVTWLRSASFESGFPVFPPHPTLVLAPEPGVAPRLELTYSGGTITLEEPFCPEAPPVPTCTPGTASISVSGTDAFSDAITPLLPAPQE